MTFDSTRPAWLAMTGCDSARNCCVFLVLRHSTCRKRVLCHFWPLPRGQGRGRGGEGHLRYASAASTPSLLTCWCSVYDLGYVGNNVGCTYLPCLYLPTLPWLCLLIVALRTCHGYTYYGCTYLPWLSLLATALLTYRGSTYSPWLCTYYCYTYYDHAYYGYTYLQWLYLLAVVILTTMANLLTMALLTSRCTYSRWLYLLWLYHLALRMAVLTMAILTHFWASCCSLVLAASTSQGSMYSICLNGQMQRNLRLWRWLA